MKCMNHRPKTQFLSKQSDPSSSVMSNCPEMTRFVSPAFAGYKPCYSLRYMNIFCFKELPSPPLTPRLLSLPGSCRINLSLFSSPSGIAPQGPEHRLSTPCSVWDCKGRNFFSNPQNFFLLFSRNQKPTKSPLHQTPEKHLNEQPSPPKRDAKVGSIYSTCKSVLLFFYRFLP